MDGWCGERSAGWLAAVCLEMKIMELNKTDENSIAEQQGKAELRKTRDEN